MERVRRGEGALWLNLIYIAAQCNGKNFVFNYVFFIKVIHHDHFFLNQI